MTLDEALQRWAERFAESKRAGEPRSNTWQDDVFEDSLVSDCLLEMAADYLEEAGYDLSEAKEE